MILEMLIFLLAILCGMLLDGLWAWLSIPISFIPFVLQKRRFKREMAELDREHAELMRRLDALFKVDAGAPK